MRAENHVKAQALRARFDVLRVDLCPHEGDLLVQPLSLTSLNQDLGSVPANR
jgi:hypothetical protein